MRRCYFIGDEGEGEEVGIITKESENLRKLIKTV